MSDNPGPPKSPISGERSAAASSDLDEQSRLQLAHELCMNENLEMSMPDPNSIVGHVKQIVHRAFWDSVRAGLQQSPPDFEHSLRLIAEIKGILLDLVPAQVQRAKDQINEVMDIELYKQQIENETFNLQGVVKFVVELMLGLCAPARDTTIRSILSQSDPVEVFREVFGALDLMRLDMANYQLRSLRPALLANSVQYEQDKFRSLLANNPATLDKTKMWLASTDERMRASGQPVSPSTLLNNAFIRVIQEEVDPIPETIAMDISRFITIARELSAVVFSAATILVLQTGVGPALQQDSFANKVRVTVYQLCSDELISHPRDILPNITEKLIDIVRETITARPLRDEECQNIRGMLSGLQSPSNPVYCLLWERAKQFFTSLCSGVVGPVPAGFSVCSADVQGVASKYTHLVSYNRGVFGPFYADIISEITSSQQAAISAS